MPNNGKNATIAGGGFHHLAIRAYDFDATLTFYCEGLGFVRRHGWGTDERAAGGKDSRAALLDTGDGNYLEVFAGREGDPNEELPEGAHLHWCLRTTDPDAAYERAMKAGAKSLIEPKSVTPGNSDTPLEFRIAFVKGLNGEIIEFFYNDTL